MIQMMLYDTNSRTADYINERLSQKNVSPVSDISVLKDSLEQHKCIVCGGHLNEAALEYFQKMIDKYSANAALQKLLEIKGDIKRSLDISRYETEKKKLFDEINELEQRREDLEYENDILYTRITAVGSVNGIEVAIQQREDNERLKNKNLEKRGEYRKEFENLKKISERKEEEYKSALRSSDACQEIYKKRDFVFRAKELLSEIKTGIVSDVTQRLSQRTKMYFDRFHWKEHTYGDIVFDENFQIKVYHKVTKLPCFRSTSAAEKELLALSFTLALHEVSGYDNLLFIDTPVGRVSDENRKNFANVLLEVSKNKQIILSFTPSEYSSEIAAVLHSSVVSSYLRLKTTEISTTKGEN